MADLKPGMKITLNGTEYQAPNWNLAALKNTVIPIIERINEKWGGLATGNAITMGQMGEQMADICTLYHLALKRNYPDLTPEQMEEDFDFADFTAMANGLAELMKQNGFVTQTGETSVATEETATN